MAEYSYTSIDVYISIVTVGRTSPPCLQPAPKTAAVFPHPPQRVVPSRNALPQSNPSCAAHNAKETMPAEGLRPWRAQGVSPVFRASLVQTGLRPPSTAFGVGDTPLLALAAPAGVGQGQGVFGDKHSTAISKTEKPHHEHP
jgi:hypothetical protein